jgi:hypothetical protein
MYFFKLEKRTEGVAQMVECLLNNQEALNSIPSTAKKKKKKLKLAKELSYTNVLLREYYLRTCFK